MRIITLFAKKLLYLPNKFYEKILTQELYDPK